MKIRQYSTSKSDQKSAVVFFEAAKRLWDLSGAVALDMFARNGQLTVQRYARDVKMLDLWELMPEHKNALKLFGARSVQIGCSYDRLKHCWEKYDFVVIDTPQGIHKAGDGSLKCEHFDVLPLLPQILAKESIIVLYVNKYPYDRAQKGSHGYDEYPEYDFEAWMKRREEFYGSRNVFEEEALRAYRSQLFNAGLSVRSTLMVPCFSDVPDLEPYAFRVGLQLQRI